MLERLIKKHLLSSVKTDAYVALEVDCGAAKLQSLVTKLN